MAPLARQEGGGAGGDYAHVCVAVRCRPQNAREAKEAGSSVVECRSPAAELVLKSKEEEHKFCFDHVFGEDTSQQQIFDTLGVAVLDQAFEGYNSTIFAYGQTGSGKTHTMMNHSGGSESHGLVPRISSDLYRRIHDVVGEHGSRSFLVQCSFLEVYNEVIYDLLAPRGKQAKGGGLEVKEAKGIGIYVKDLTEVVVEDAERLTKLIRDGFESRATGATKMNDTSSRSHCVFSIKLHQKDSEDRSLNTISKVNLVDLAGSERVRSTGAEGLRLKEGANINKSLSALGNVINALSSMASGKRKVFVPYRDSKLTRVLQESLGGNCLCTMVAAISPAADAAEETLSTLNYARRAKVIKVTARKNEEASQVVQLSQEVNEMRRKLEEAQAAAAPGESRELEERHLAQIATLESFISQSWEDKQRLSAQHEEERRRAQEEAQRAAEHIQSEQQRRLQLLAQQGDLELTLQSITALNCDVGASWSGRIGAVVASGQRLAAQLRAVRLYRESAAVDLETLWGTAADPAADPSAAILLLGHIRTKLGSLSKELGDLEDLQEQLALCTSQAAPEVAVALCDASTETEELQPQAAAQRRELVQLLELLREQLASHFAKARERLVVEGESLGFQSEASKLAGLLERLPAVGDGGDEDPEDAAQLVAPLVAELQAASVAGAPGGAEPAAQLPSLLGISTMEVPDAQLRASSNEGATMCARLLRSLAYGGWSPDRDDPDKYLEVDLGSDGPKLIAGISTQGRVPCSGKWSQTYELLRVALGPAAPLLQIQPKTFMRPPVKLTYAIVMELAKEGCFDSAKETWQMPEKLLHYETLSKEEKIEFFQELIDRTNRTFEEAWSSGVPALGLTPLDILAGRNCVETNRLLQLLAYLSLTPLENGSGARCDVAPQWTSSWRLQRFTEEDGWQWCGIPSDAEEAAEAPAPPFEGNSDAEGVKYVRFPEPYLAAKLRIFPVTWHRHAALRCEVHLAPARPETGSNGRSLRAELDLVARALAVLKQGMEHQHRSLQLSATMEKEQAHQERTLLEQRLADATARLEGLEGQHTALQVELLAARAENARLSEAVVRLEAAASEAKAAAERQIPALQRDREELQASVDDLTEQLHVALDERDVARAHQEELFNAMDASDEEVLRLNRQNGDLREQLEAKEVEEDATEMMVEQFDSLNEQLTELQAREGEAAAKYEEAAARCEQLEHDLAVLSAEAEALRKERDAGAAALLQSREGLGTKGRPTARPPAEFRMTFQTRTEDLLRRDSPFALLSERPGSRGKEEAGAIHPSMPRVVARLHRALGRPQSSGALGGSYPG